MMNTVLFFVYGLIYFVGLYSASHEESMHPSFDDIPRAVANDEELTSEYWNTMARQRILLQHQRVVNKNKAKNVIFFMGDGMSITTQTAARAYIGQMEGKFGEEVELSFEKFPVSGLVKTYCLDMQVGESACTATAYLSGIKANFGTVGVNGKVPRMSCEMMMDKSTHVESLAKVFLDAGKSVGMVTTSSIVDASPAGMFGHTAERLWKSDRDVVIDGYDPTLCRDLAHQLVHGETGRRLKVILGGGRSQFISNKTNDEEGYKGNRWDGRNLIEEWKTQKHDAGKSGTYVWNKSQLMSVNDSSDFLLGLFEPIECQYNLKANKTTEPSFIEMMEVAIKLLSQNEKGYFLFAEGGLIDQAHHGNMARLALDETAEFSKAISRAASLTSENDTLLVVTADHSHTMTISGYPSRGNDILGPSDKSMAIDGKPYLTLGYSNGPGYRSEVGGSRVDVTKEDMENVEFKYPARMLVPAATHGGEDVGIYALGPWQHLFTGVFEQSAIPHIIKYASCVDDQLSACSSAGRTISSIALLLLTVILGSIFIS